MFQLVHLRDVGWLADGDADAREEAEVEAAQAGGVAGGPVPDWFAAHEGDGGGDFFGDGVGHFEVGDHGDVAVGGDGAVEWRAAVVGDEGVGGGEDPAAFAVDGAQGVEGIEFAGGGDEVILAAHLQLDVAEEDGVGARDVRYGDPGEEIELVQMGGLPQFACLEVELGCGSSAHRDFLAESDREGLGGGKGELASVFCVNVFDDEVI